MNRTTIQADDNHLAGLGMVNQNTLPLGLVFSGVRDDDHSSLVEPQLDHPVQSDAYNKINK